MTEHREADCQASVDIAADAVAVYDLITHLPSMCQVAAETTAMEWVQGDAAVPGAKFKGTNKAGSKSWSTACTGDTTSPPLARGPAG
jgi:hypothetical protein